MAEEPNLPPIPAVTWNAGTQTLNRRKRFHGDTLTEAQLFSNSSDPAVFSSDDDPNVDNYIHGKRHKKKRYVGSWYQQNLASSDSTFSEDRTLPEKSERTFERHFDSGVWMGSDSSDDILDDLPQFTTKREAPQLPSQPTISGPEEDARDKIQNCIDEGNEVVDLSGMGLEELSDATVAQLDELVCIPTVAEDVPFEHKEPALQLFLAANPLARAPGAIFQLEHLSVLSLRNTQITHVPSTIGGLRNLTSLNLSLNQLSYLPGELLNLMGNGGKLTDLKIRPNPFWEPAWLEGSAAQPDCPDVDLSDRVALPCLEAVYYARSSVQFSDSRGVVRSKFHLKPRQLEQDGKYDLWAATSPSSNPDPEPTELAGRRALSLFELALKACSQGGRLRELAAYIEPVAAPQVLDAFDQVASRAERNADDGHVSCAVCRRTVVMPTAQWIEWHNIASSSMEGNRTERVVPFLRRGCSWTCAPEARSSHGKPN